MNCKDKGYEVGQVFEVFESDEGAFSLGSIIVLSKDDNSCCPKFDLVQGICYFKAGILTENGAHENLENVKRIYPPEESKAPEDSKAVEVTCEGKTVQISRESAKAIAAYLNPWDTEE